MRVEQALRVERHDLVDQAAVRVVRRGLDRHVHRAEKFRQLARPEGEPGHHAKTAPATALDPPEEVGIRAGVGDPDGAVGGDDLGLEQTGSRQTVSL